MGLPHCDLHRVGGIYQGPHGRAIHCWVIHGDQGGYCIIGLAILASKFWAFAGMLVRKLLSAGACSQKINLSYRSTSINFKSI